MQDKREEISFFDSFESDGYDVFAKRGYNRILHEFQTLVNPMPGEIAIDFGCGTGAFTSKLRRFRLKIRGIDISKGCIEYARKKYKGIKFGIRDIEKTGLRSNSVDIVVFSGVLHHFQDFSVTVKEAYRVLRKGGRVFAYDPNKKNPIMWMYRDRKSPIHSTKGKTKNERLLTVEEIHKVLIKAGFHDVIVRGISDVGFKYVKSNIGKLFLPAYNIIEWAIDKTPFARYYGSFLISKGEK
ncbi:class I SAM-dependent methyltransferase [Candidatus Woesearchaeota archaeon]|nr:class I SAM-dependent methyltransferase [Candidatus Woesearchaeota archaeon]